MHRSRPIQAVALVIALAILLTGCGGSARPASGDPATTGQAARTVEGLPDLPGDMAALRAALGESRELTYKIILADAPSGTDKNQYLDRLLEKRDPLAKDEVVLLIFPQDNHDIRFAMGAVLSEKQVTVQSMLDTVRQHYFAKGRSGDPAGGLADLIRAVNRQAK